MGYKCYGEIKNMGSMMDIFSNKKFDKSVLDFLKISYEEKTNY